ncbi:undecaprenyldiphospho-muramoylpentapeptide beta-N-acetylglucosaminyltransferase [Paenibacillus sp. CAA11]|uniref:undecaprenyldiphospho-muramoylpentapeptide beta-N-acetylglucosaminyltransferase n=1 Tax=Paenibacillus sp. CAA11 TaxID=1532905 RepID=UPI000D35FB9B|nr:undecaprenyldiphospho-muramoylpentapeptide beta-N-acetylglucosaminyltransferase [Paenibacillus sp. CAA11]AWB43265.1 undecaprenyldiphospho-muramoylpentapeptide beta-N-acetylglucosaminyltransferase [Paenibacillus sp. CAA11]
MKKIIFTGGGSAGHVTVNMALIPKFIHEGWSVDYIGSANGIERQLIHSKLGVTYHSISTGKLRRYLDWKNIKDPFKVVKGVIQAYKIINRQKPDIVFSKGGFVSVPVVIGAWLNKVPVIIHESDLTPGLANKIASKFSSVVCTTFPETAAAFSHNKCRYVGPVLREEMKKGSRERGRKFTGIVELNKPIVLVMGGSLGSRNINEAVRQSLPKLTKQFAVVHLCGKGNLDPTISYPEYRQYEYINEELPDLLAMCDLVISRAGSNSIFEFLSLKRPMLLIPLSKQQSRGDQILNAGSFEQHGYCKVLYEENLSPSSLTTSIEALAEDKDIYVKNMGSFKSKDALTDLYDLIIETSNNG